MEATHQEHTVREVLCRLLRVRALQVEAAYQGHTVREGGAGQAWFEPLLRAATPDIYRSNAFRLAALPVESSERDIKRRLDKLRMMQDLGGGVAFKAHIAIDPAPSGEVIRDALQRLMDPEQRLIEELFWFWPVAPAQAKTDEPLRAIERGDLPRAEQLWLAIDSADERGPAARHNLAILHHVLALDREARLLAADDEASRLIGSGLLTDFIKERRGSWNHDDWLKLLSDIRAAGYKTLPDDEVGRLLEAAKREAPTGVHRALSKRWSRALSSWAGALDLERVWSRLSDRAREMQDPRLGPDVVRQIRNTMPVALAAINAQLAVRFAENQAPVHAGRHRNLLDAWTVAEGGWSGASTSAINEAVRRSVATVRRRITAVCETATAAAGSDPAHADRASQALLEGARPLLSVLTSAVPDRSPQQAIVVRDAVARALLKCQVLYANKTDDWTTSRRLLGEAEVIAGSEGQRTLLREQIGTVERNAENVWWCSPGYFDLPEPIVAGLEKARSQVEADAFADAILVMIDVLMDRGACPLSDEQKRPVRHALAFAFNRRSTCVFNVAMKEYNDAPDSIKMRIVARAKSGGYDPGTVLAAQTNGPLSGVSLTCMACGSRIDGACYRIQINEKSKAIICPGCSHVQDEELAHQKAGLRVVVLSAAEYVQLAHDLEPEEKTYAKNLEEIRLVITRLDFSIALTSIAELRVKHGLAPIADLLVATKDSSAAMRSAAEQALTRHAPALARQRKIKRRVKRAVFGLAAAALAAGAFVFAMFSNGNPRVVAELHRYHIIDSDRAIEKLASKGLLAPEEPARDQALKVLGGIDPSWGRSAAADRAIAELVPALVARDDAARARARAALALIDAAWPTRAATRAAATRLAEKLRPECLRLTREQVDTFSAFGQPFEPFVPCLAEIVGASFIDYAIADAAALVLIEGTSGPGESLRALQTITTSQPRAKWKTATLVKAAAALASFPETREQGVSVLAELATDDSWDSTHQAPTVSRAERSLAVAALERFVSGAAPAAPPLLAVPRGARYLPANEVERRYGLSAQDTFKTHSDVVAAIHHVDLDFPELVVTVSPEANGILRLRSGRELLLISGRVVARGVNVPSAIVYDILRRSAAARRGDRWLGRTDPEMREALALRFDGISKKEAEVKSETAPTGAGAVGVVECDEFVKRMSDCTTKVSPEAAVPMRESMKRMAKAWKEAKAAASTPEASKVLAQGCVQALHAARKAYAASGCRF